MRILYITEALDQRLESTSARVTHALARMAQREGHQVQVLAAAPGLPASGKITGAMTQGRRSLVEGVPVWQFDGLASGLDDTQFASWVSEQRFDVWQEVVEQPRSWPFDALSAGHTPLVMTLTGLPPDAAAGADAACVARLARAALRVVPSAFAAQQWQAAAPNLRFQVLAHGIDLLGLIRARQAGEANGPQDGPPTLLCVGPWDEQSGVRALLAALATVAQPDLRLALLGDVDAASACGQAVGLALAADSRVALVGESGVRSLADVEFPFDALCLPNLMPQAFSVLARECVALGMGCLASEVGDQADTLRHRGCGPLLQPGDVAAWGRAINQWREAFTRSRQPMVHGEVPMRIEEAAFLYEGMYRDLIYRSRR